MAARPFFCCLTAVLAGVALGMADDGEPKPEPTVTSLEAAVRAWQRDLFAEDADVRLATIDAMWPTAKDVAAVFPEHGEKLGQFYALVKEKMKERMKAAPEEALQKEREKAATLRRIQTFDVREEKASQVYEAVLQLIPREVPVYRIVAEYEKGSAGSSGYVFVNGHWVQFQNLTSVPEILPKLDEILPRDSSPR